MIFATLLAAAAAAAPAPICKLTDSGGYVDRMTWVGKSKKGPLPQVTNAAREPVDLREVDHLCPGDTVTNPQGSPLIVVLRVRGVERTLRPGQASLTIPAPGWLEGSIAARLLALLDPQDRGRHSIQAAIVKRGSTVENAACSFAPGAMGEGDQLVVGDLPIYLRWFCDPQARPVRVVVKIKGATPTSLPIAMGLARLTPRDDCAIQCTVELQDNANSVLAEMAIATRSRAALTDDRAQLVAGDARARAVAGADMLQDRLWRLQGASLLLDAACEFPSAAAASMDIFQFEKPSALCALAPRR